MFLLLSIVQGSESIPDIGTRITIGIAVTFVFLILAILVYLKMTRGNDR